MSDEQVVSATANPSQEQGGASDYAQFLGTDAPELDTPAETNPETAAEEIETEEGATEETEEQTAEVETEEIADDWLPEEQEKEFPVETLAKYAKRFGYTLDEVKADPRLQLALKDKINSDIYIRQQKEAAEQAATEETTATEPETAQAPLPPDKQREAYQQQVEQIIDGSFDKQVVADLGKNVMKIMGYNFDLLADKNISAEDRAMLQGAAQQAPELGKTLARAGVDMVMTTLNNPAVMSQVIDKVFPGFGEMYETAMYARTWDQVRATNEAYGKLPAYGTPEFGKAMRAAAAQIPGFNNMVFTDQSGRPLPKAQQAAQQYAILAKMATGQQVNPAVVAKAVETGKKQERTAQRVKTAGRVLGAGRSTQQLAPSTGPDPLDAEIARMNGDLTPFAK